MKAYKVIGLMSGTSLDGIDAALLHTDGESYIQREDFLTVPYDDGLRDRIRRCLNAPVDDFVRQVEHDLTLAHIEAVRKLLRAQKITAAAVDLIGFHGQTIAHAPEKRMTCQIGDGVLLARETGIRVVNDFRSADVHAGGQGAPLVPVYHQALAAALAKPVAFLNIGGVANVTYVGPNGEVIAFDTGPGNALLDDWILQKTGRKFDEKGALSLKGKVDGKVLAQVLAHPFFAAEPPKSIDRDVFASNAWRDLSPEDGAATLAAFTVGAVARAQDFLPAQPVQWVVSGGGRLNAALIEGLRVKLSSPVNLIEDIGLNGDAIEAEAFAYMAVRSLKGLPISFPKTTGVPHPMPGGKINAVSDAA